MQVFNISVRFSLPWCRSSSRIGTVLVRFWQLFCSCQKRIQKLHVKLVLQLDIKGKQQQVEFFSISYFPFFVFG